MYPKFWLHSLSVYEMSVVLNKYHASWERVWEIRKHRKKIHPSYFSRKENVCFSAFSVAVSLKTQTGESSAEKKADLGFSNKLGFES